MNNAKHEVTVHDRVASTAQVSVAQVEAYLRRTGWIEFDPYSQPRWWTSDGAGVHLSLSYVDSDEIERIARVEQRQPSAVLADIAREPAS